MTRSNAVRYASWRDFWLCLSHAFAVPEGSSYREAFVISLSEDLDAISYEIGLNIAQDIEMFSLAARELAGELDIQRLHAELFSVPPTPVFANTAIYLDGAFLGESELEIMRWYGRHGFERRDTFRDLGDHVAVQLEFIGRLYEKASQSSERAEDIEAQALATEAERFIDAFPRRWIGPFLTDLQDAVAARRLNGAYLHLARILWLGVERASAHGAQRFEQEADAPLPAGSARGIGSLTAEDLAEIATRLSGAGLGIDHVRLQPGWSDEVFDRHRAKMPLGDTSQ